MKENWGYVQCGQKLCHGNSATCCSWDKNECCWMSWYTMWWLWVGAIIATAVIFCMVICCCSRKRRKSNVRHIILVPPQPTSYYGSITSQQPPNFTTIATNHKH
ncbi:hypothetical protein CHUAL_000504 [Chamberlinius hualienensis]